MSEKSELEKWAQTFNNRRSGLASYTIKAAAIDGFLHAIEVGHQRVDEDSEYFDSKPLTGMQLLEYLKSYAGKEQK